MMDSLLCLAPESSDDLSQSSEGHVRNDSISSQLSNSSVESAEVIQQVKPVHCRKRSVAMENFLQNVERKASVFDEMAANRVKAASAWTVKELFKLFELMKKVPTFLEVPECAVASVKFGDLFTAAADVMEALAGTLKIARKHGLVSYKPDVLFERVHDEEQIILLTSTVSAEVQAAISKADEPTLPKTVVKGGFDFRDETVTDYCYTCTKMVLYFFHIHFVS